MHQHVYFAYLPVIDWVCLKMGLIFQHFADCCISSHLDCAFLGLCTVLKQLHANKFSQRADGISRPLIESERNESSTTSESVTLRPPLGFWGRGVTALRRASISIHIYVCIYIICMFFFKHATCMSLSGTGSSDDCSMTILAYNSTYGLGNFQAWFRFYLGLV